MFSTVNLDKFPIVLIEFNGGISNEQEFQQFTACWENLYYRNKEFILVFDTTKMDAPNPKYCILMANFMKKIKQKNPQYLRGSIIIIDGEKVLTLLQLIFNIQLPVANVYITKEKSITILSYLNNINDLYEISNHIEILDTFKPQQTTSSIFSNKNQDDNDIESYSMLFTN